MAELNAVDANSIENSDQGNANQTLRFCSSSALDTAGISRAENNKEEEEELRRLLVPRIEDLPSVPSSAVESNFVTYYAPGRTNFSMSCQKLSKIRKFLKNPSKTLGMIINNGC